MNMTTNIENIPLKTNRNDLNNDDSDDPVVKDILNEFEQELKINSNQSQEQQSPMKPSNDYVVNYQQPVQASPQACAMPSRKAKGNTNSYYNEEFLRKTAIIVVIIAFIFSPIIFSTVLDKIPETFKDTIDTNSYYIKLLLSFATIYLLYHYKLLT